MVAARLAVLTLLWSGCAIEKLDLAGQPCPCAGGWICDTSNDVCVQRLSLDGSPDVADSAPIPGAISVADLRSTWATPNVIRWDWEPMGESDKLSGYELVLGPTEEAVLARDESVVRVWTPDDNPELGRYLLPRVGGEDVVRFTMTYELAPDTLYYAQLVATDTANRTWASNIASGRTTLEATNEIVVFADTDTAGYSIPGSFALSQNAPLSGDSHYEYTSVCEMGALLCYENLRRQHPDNDLSGIGMGPFLTSAFFEIAVASDATETSWWSHLRLRYTSRTVWQFQGWTMRSDGAYRVLQVPLRVLENAGGTTPYEELDEIYEFGIGGQWENGSTVRIDEVRIRW